MNVIKFTSRAARYWKRNGQYWSAGKLANAALAQLAMRLKLRYVPARPVVAKIEATNICNGTCRLCPVGRKEPGHRPYGMLAWDTYRRLIDQSKATLHAVDLTNWGESLLHKQILDMVRYAHDARLYTYLSTNLHTVRPQHYTGLMRCGLDELALSLHGLSEKTYQAYQPGFQFNQACRIIEQLAQARRDCGRTDTLKIKLNFVVTAVNEHESADLPAFAERMGVDWLLSEPSLNLRFTISPELTRKDPDKAREIVARMVREWLPRKGQYDRPLYRQVEKDPTRMYSPRKIVPCEWPWTKLVVNCDGGLSICCGSYNHRDDIGQYTWQPIGQLWNSRAYRQCRASFSPAAATNGVICSRCPGLLL